MVDVSVVVPCFDEGEVVGALHAAVVAALEPTGAVFEICYVDDGSRDGTVERLRELARADARVRYTSFSRNFGKESALLAGMRMSRGAAVVLMDADLQHPPELLPRMLELRRHGYDQVVARRDRSGENPVRRALSRAYYRLVRRFMEVEVVDGARRLQAAVAARRGGGPVAAGEQPVLQGPVLVDRLRHGLLPLRERPRAAGASKWGGRRLLDYGIDGLLSFNSRPLRLAVHTGSWLFLSALAYALWIVANALLDGVDTPGYATLITAVVGLSGVQLATLGVIGEYVGRIYHESKRRPHYVVRETDRDAPGSPAAGPAASGAGRRRP
ncbi:glycosyltransferase [Streptomyces somaliensis]|uniref:glycosyltransferase n=1 Tax=Streptomyces somaliensis TaxID=78355 RepID=UPI003F74FEFA